MVSKPIILPTNFYEGDQLEVIQELAPKNFELIFLKEASQKELINTISLADYLLVGGRLQINSEVLEHAKRLKMVQRTGAGLDNMDFHAFRKRSLPLYVNFGVNANSVAEHTIMMMLALLRNMPLVHETTKLGKWNKHGFGLASRGLKGKIVGLFGMGHIGLEVARLLQVFNVKVLYNKPNRLSSLEEKELGISYCTLEELLKNSDIISLHASLNASTKHVINIESLKQMKSSSYLINTSRGQLVDEPALVEALNKRIIRGAALDVFEKEPFDASNGLFQCENVILTPHIGGVTTESFTEMMRAAFKNIELFHNGFQTEIEHKRVKL